MFKRYFMNYDVEHFMGANAVSGVSLPDRNSIKVYWSTDIK